jgi:hypothetical protein
MSAQLETVDKPAYIAMCSCIQKVTTDPEYSKNLTF